MNAPAKLALFALVGGFAFAGHALAEKSDRDKPLHIQADLASVDDANQTSVFTGNVIMTQGTLIIRGDKIVITQDKDGFKHGTATGKQANFRQKREGLDEYVEGYGDRIEYDTRTETLDLYGKARMKREQDEANGEHIAYDSKTEVFRVVGSASRNAPLQGRAHAILQPRSKDAAPAPKSEPVPLKPADNLSGDASAP